ncbi:MAG: hypothetical protein JNK79_18500 [Chitinophagaceae bacterium]|nr:hypothetical protein [Chitinophagaceae bacterium]
MKFLLLLLLAIPLCYGCLRNPDFHAERSDLAFVPVYADTHNLRPVTLEATRPITNAGKIYVYGNYIFQNEQNEGIHIIDNSDPLHPEKKAFLAIPFNTEMAIRASHIYANSINDILVIDLINPLKAQVVNRIKNAFPLIAQDYPPESGYFVCPDPSKGIVVDWKLEPVTEAKCRR